jgi:hypothetical protein
MTGYDAKTGRTRKTTFKRRRRRDTFNVYNENE